jgi:outer membrane protein OmpA-like peptidoglycan-associated protein
MTFYLSLADKSSYALKDIQVLITEEQLKPCYKNNSCEKTIKPSKATKKQYKVYSNRDDIYFSDKRSWMKYSFEFTAEGYENYFSIGNFYRNPKTKKHKVLSTSPLFFSYYYIDDVSIEAIEKEVYENVDTPKNENKDKVLKVNKIYKFNNVLFNFDKADLLKVSLNELDELYLYLNENSALSIEIYGHTDNVGTNERNKELSEQRAKAVADYLISLGLSSTRIKSFGFGSLKPVAENKTEKGRQLNRRVEFKI